MFIYDLSIELSVNSLTIIMHEIETMTYNFNENVTMMI